MATAMATMAHTEDSRPGADARRARWWPGRCGPPRRSPAPGAVSVEVKYSVRRLTTWASTRPMTTAPKHAPAGVRCRCRCRRRPRATSGGADDGEDAGGEEAPVDGGHGRLVLVGGPHREDADDRGQHADGPGGHREDEAERRGWPPMRLEGGDAEDDRGDEGDLVALEQVGGHAGAVAHVVAHVVGDGGRVAGVVLGDAGLDLAHQVGADVGRLGEDAAADPQEQGQQRAAEAEADEDGRAGVLEDHDDDVAPSRPRPTVNMPATPPVRKATLRAAGQRAGPGRGRGAHVAPHGQAHADEAGEAGQEAAGEEGQGPEDARLDEASAPSSPSGLTTSVDGEEHDRRPAGSG